MVAVMNAWGTLYLAYNVLTLSALLFARIFG